MFDTVKIIKAPTPCLYAYNNCTIVVDVEDLIISGPNVEEVTELKSIIKGLFVCTDAGDIKEYLGVLFERRDDDTFVLSQRQYLLNVIQRFGMEDCKPCATPRVPKKTIDEARTDMSCTTFPFRKAIGSLLYLAARTRPDISFTVEILGRAMVAQSAKDFVAVKRLMRYLSGTRDYGLVLDVTGESKPIAYSNADWGGNVDHKSTSGALHYFGEDLLHWTSKKQGCVALSTAEEEYVAASICAQDVIWLRIALCDFNYQQRELTVIFEDNTAAIKWSSGSSRRAKHIDIKVCFVHEVMSMKQAILKYLSTAEQVADILTKLLRQTSSAFCATSLASREEVCWHKMSA
jgi:Reverse transcriptase (RNA-dependent DNA polymerase)